LTRIQKSKYTYLPGYKKRPRFFLQTSACSWGDVLVHIVVTFSLSNVDPSVLWLFYTISCLKYLFDIIREVTTSEVRPRRDVHAFFSWVILT
jgi:hypothetical protein